MLAGGLEAFDGDIAVAGVFPGVLSDAAIESMPFTLAAWYSLTPLALWVLDQQAVAQTVNDLAGGGSQQSAITGTTVSTQSVPLFNYTDGAVEVTREAGGAGATVTPAVVAATATVPAGNRNVAAGPLVAAATVATPATTGTSAPARRSPRRRRRSRPATATSPPGRRSCRRWRPSTRRPARPGPPPPRLPPWSP